MAENAPSSEITENTKQTLIFQRLGKYKDIICSAVLNLDEYFACFLRVVSCNADFPCSFSEAWCLTERSCKCARFKELYDAEIVTEFLETGKLEGSWQNQAHLQVALERLADFLEDSDDTNRILLKWVEKCKKESQWARLFATHIIKKLISSKGSFMIISDAGYAKDEYCMCGCGEPLIYGDTSMGHKQAWHGSVDIILENVAIDIAQEPTYDDEDDDPDSAFELNRENLEMHRHQLVAKAIVFGCVQQQCTLAPLIAVSMEKFKVYLYDHDSDLLFETMEFELNLPLPFDTVLALWLVIHHSLFGFGVRSGLRKLGISANLKKFLSDRNKLELYDKQMHMFQCKKVHTLLPPMNTFMEQKKRRKSIEIVDAVEKNEEKND